MPASPAEQPERRVPRVSALLGALALVVAACSGLSDSSTTTSTSTAAPVARAVVVTTDLGPGDVAAIAHLLTSPDIDVRGVLIDGDVLLDCTTATNHVLRIAALGNAAPAVSCRPVDSPTTATDGLRQAAEDLYGLDLPDALGEGDDRAPADVLAELIATTPGPLDVVALGSLTHLDTALASDDALASTLGHVYLPADPGAVAADAVIALQPITAERIDRHGLSATIVTLPGGLGAISPVLVNSDLGPTGALLTGLAPNLPSADGDLIATQLLTALVATDEIIARYRMEALVVGTADAPSDVRIRVLTAIDQDRLVSAIGSTTPPAPVTTGPVDFASLPQGRLVWEFALAGGLGTQPGAKSRASHDNGTLYIAGFDGVFYAIDTRDGSEIWQHPLEAAGPTWVEVGMSPEAVFLRELATPTETDPPAIVALDRADGSEIWRIPLVVEDSGPPRTPVYGEGVLIYGAEDVGMVGADPLTGATLWTLDSAVASNAGQATITDGAAFFGLADGSVVAVEVDTGQQLWRVQTRPSQLGVTSTPALADGVVYVGSDSGQVLALDAISGDIIWEVDLSPVIGLPSSPVVADGRVILGTFVADGQAGLIALDARTGEEIWRDFRTIAGIGGLVGSPAYADGVVYIVDDGHGWLVAYDAVSGDPLWTFGLADVGSDSPIVVDGVVYFQVNGAIFAVAPPE